MLLSRRLIECPVRPLDATRLGNLDPKPDIMAFHALLTGNTNNEETKNRQKETFEKATRNKREDPILQIPLPFTILEPR